jgi:probable F420-dependent oxidoreductase
MAHDRRFRFGVIAKNERTGADLAAFARQVEAWGYATFYVPDHFVDHAMAPFPTLAAVAAATESLRVGTLVLGNDYRHPVVVANDAATVDLLSNGRLELGLGAGWMTADYQRGGWPLDRPGVRIARLEESIAVIKGLMADGPFTFQGEHYQIDGLEGVPKPVQRPHPPLVIGGGGPKILALAARHAQIVGVNANLAAGVGEHQDSMASLAATATDEKLDRLRAAAGPGFDDLEIQTLTGFVHVTDDRRSLAEAIASGMGAPDATVALQTPALLVGTIDEIIAEVQARRDRWAMSYVVVPEEFAEAFAPVVAELNGT